MCCPMFPREIKYCSNTSTDCHPPEFSHGELINLTTPVKKDQIPNPVKTKLIFNVSLPILLTKLDDFSHSVSV